jgi:hypothetical protein
MKGGYMLDVLFVAIQGLSGVGLLYGGITTFRNWHLSELRPSAPNDA